MKTWGFCKPLKNKETLYVFQNVQENFKDTLCLKNIAIDNEIKLQAILCDKVNETYEDFLFSHGNFILKNIKNQTLGNYFLDDQGRMLNIQTKKCLRINKNITKLSVLDELNHDQTA